MRFTNTFGLFLIVFFVSACGRSMLYNTSIFQSYVTTFEKESITYGKPTQVLELVIKFSTELEDKIVGQCQRRAGTSPTILININWWEQLTAEQKEILLFHEIGHCILGLGHDDSSKAIMNTHLLFGWYGNREKLLSDYFKNPVDGLAAMRYSINRKVGYVPHRCRN